MLLKRLLAALLILGSPVAHAITYVAAGTKGEVNGTSITPGAPAGVAQNDVEILVLGHADVAATINAVSGWTCETQVGGTISNNGETRICHRTVPASPTYPTPTTDTSGSFFGKITAFAGVDTTTRLDVGPTCTVDETGTNPSMVAPTVTTTVANAMVVRVFWTNNGEASHTTHSETLQWQDGTTLGQDNQFSLTAQVQASAGATGTATATNTATSSQHWIACTFALTPAGAGSPSVVFDASTYDLGSVVTATLTGFTSGTPTSVTEQGGGDTLTASGNTSQVTFTLWDLDDLVPAGSGNNVQLLKSLTIQVSNGTESATDTITLNCPDEMYCGDLACNGFVQFADYAANDCPGDTLAPETALINDDYICRVPLGNAAVNEYLRPAIDYSGVLGAIAIDCRIFPEAGGAWLSEFSTPFDLPTTEFLTEDTDPREAVLCSDGKYREVCP